MGALGRQNAEISVGLLLGSINGVAAHHGVAQCLGSMGHSVRLIGGILGMLGGAEKRGERADQRGAIAADPQSSGFFVGGQILSQNAPSGNSSIVGGAHGRHSGGGLHDLKAASPRILAAVP